MQERTALSMSKWNALKKTKHPNEKVNFWKLESESLLLILCRLTLDSA